MSVVIPDKAILRMAKFKQATNGSGVAQIDIKVPGTYSNSDGRYIEGGQAFFEVPNFDDWVECYIVDIDNILGYGANTVIGSYTDTELPSGNEGWYFSKVEGQIKVLALAGMGWIPAELYLRIIAHKDPTNLSDTLRVNLNWGVRE